MRRLVRSAVKVCVILILFVVLVSCNVIRLCRISGDSMYSTLSDGTFGIALAKSQYDYGDIVVARAEYKGQPCNIVKRIVGLPGDTIYYENGAVYRNGERLQEDYLDSWSKTEGAPYKVNEGYYILGDNRAISYDSRYFGSVTNKNVLGRYYSVNGTYKGIGITGLIVFLLIIFVFV